MSESEKRTKEMAQWVKGVCLQAYDLSLIPRTYTVGGRTDAYELSSGLHVCTMAHAH